MLPFAPGARAVIRDEEWLIRRVDPSTDGGWLLTCDGISHLVRSQSALFLTELEDDIEVLDPATGSESKSATEGQYPDRLGRATSGNAGHRFPVRSMQC